MMHHSGMNVPRECEVTSPPLSCPGLPGHPVRRGFSVLAAPSLEYWIAWSEPGDDTEVVFGRQKDDGYRSTHASFDDLSRNLVLTVQAGSAVLAAIGFGAAPPPGFMRNS